MADVGVLHDVLLPLDPHSTGVPDGLLAAQLDGDFVDGTITNDEVDGTQPCVGTYATINNVVTLYQAMAAGEIYLDIHSEEFPGGVVRGQVII